MVDPTAATLPTAVVQEREAAAARLRQRVETRLGRVLHPAEWRWLSSAAPDSAAELSPLEADLVVELWQLLTRWRPARGALLQLGHFVALGRQELARGLKRGAPGWLETLLVTLGFAWLTSALRSIDGLLLIGLMAVIAASTWLQRKIAVERLRGLQLVEDELPQSNILERLGENDPGLDEIMGHTPALWRWFFLGWPGRGLSDRMRLVACNLDWFLRPPATYLRWSWFRPAGTVLWVAWFVAWFARAALASDMLGLTLSILSFLLLVGVLNRHAWGKAQLPEIFTDALISSLRRRVAERALLNKHEAVEPAQPRS